MGGRLVWIPAALSTLKPATSPRLSTIKLRFTRVRSVNRPTKTLIKNMGDDLQWVIDEFARMEREFEGGVSFTVVRDSGFEELDTRKVRFRFCGVDDIPLSHLRPFPAGLSALRWLKWDLQTSFSQLSILRLWIVRSCTLPILYTHPVMYSPR